jgi:hypothetical protein
MHSTDGDVQKKQQKTPHKNKTKQKQLHTQSTWVLVSVDKFALGATGETLSWSQAQSLLKHKAGELSLDCSALTLKNCTARMWTDWMLQTCTRRVGHRRSGVGVEGVVEKEDGLVETVEVTQSICEHVSDVTQSCHGDPDVSMDSFQYFHLPINGNKILSVIS